MKPTTNGTPVGRPWRPFEAVFAVAAITLLAPVFAVAALVVLLEDGRPVLFRQKRVGRGGKPFSILKFRTMRNGGGGLNIITEQCHRITRCGAWMRKFKIDELPQLINVLRGEMSLIGPRPEVPEYVRFDDDLWRRVLDLQPGITDLATLAFRNEEAILSSAPDPDNYYRSVVLPEKLRLNVQYQRSRSFTRDLNLLWLTARYSFFPRGYNRERVLRSLGA